MSVRAIDRRWSPNMHEVRRQRIASLLIRGLKTHEIVTALSQETRAGRDGYQEPNPSYTVNPRTGNPYDRKTIERDIEELKGEWRDQSAEKIKEYYGHMLATAFEVQRAAWAKGDLDMVLEANGEIRDIVGEPTKMESFNVNVDYASLSDAQIIALREGIRIGKLASEIMADENWPE